MALFNVTGILPPGSWLLLYLQLGLVLVMIIIGPFLVKLGLLWVESTWGG